MLTIRAHLTVKSEHPWRDIRSHKSISHVHYCPAFFYAASLRREKSKSEGIHDQAPYEGNQATRKARVTQYPGFSPPLHSVQRRTIDEPLEDAVAEDAMVSMAGNLAFIAAMPGHRKKHCDSHVPDHISRIYQG